MKALIIILAIMSSITACVSASNEAQFKKVKPKQRVYVGKIEINLNGKKAEKCEVFMNSQLIPNLKLSDDGYVVYRTSDRKPLLGKVRCLHQANNRKSAWHTQSLNLEPLMRPKKRKSINYFGHLKVDWQINPQATLDAPVKNAGSFIQVGKVTESGDLKVAIQDQSSEAKSYLKTNWSALSDFRVETHLVSSRSAGEDEELDEDEE